MPPPSRRRLITGLAGGLGAVAAGGLLLGQARRGRRLDGPADATDGQTASLTSADDATGWVPTFSPRPRPAGFHAGVNLAHLHRGGLGYGSDACREQLRRLVDLGLTHVALTPFAYTEGVDGSSFTFGSNLDRSLTDDLLIQAAADARALGLAVTLKPHVWSRAFWTGGKSRQDMAPADGDWQRWFDAYTAFAVHYAAVAARMQADLYVVGLEYLQATLTGPGGWAGVARACRQHFDGPLSYAANWYQEVQAFADWAAFDFIGVNAYYPLSKRPRPDVADLVAGWQPHLDALQTLSEQHARPVLFLEAGLQAVKGAAAHPWDHSADGDSDEPLQARAYEALLHAAADRPWLRGVYWWKWFTAAQGEHRDRYAPTGRLAEQVLRAWWAG